MTEERKGKFIVKLSGLHSKPTGIGIGIFNDNENQSNKTMTGCEIKAQTFQCRES